jgi:1-acyl-sn-glycerol-3-phosphate acyltransferase
MATRRPDRRKRLEQRFFRETLRALGLDVANRGIPSTAPGTLFVANHISFADVVALATRIDATFVAKSDVRRWPLIGPLAARFGTIFVERERSLEAARQADLLASHLRAGGNLVLFPEGTTSDGRGVLPFRSALLAAAEAAGAVQPVAIRYSDAARRAYVADESFAANLLRLAPYTARVELVFLPPLDPSLRTDRKGLARAAREAVEAGLRA